MKKLTITVVSFSYRKGYPTDLNGNGGGFVLDCRFLPNPGRLEQFKNSNGKDEKVKEYLIKQVATKKFLTYIKAILSDAVQEYKKREYTHLMVCFGCTGGQHRSVYMAQTIYEWLNTIHPELNLTLEHRELGITEAHVSGFMIMCFFLYKKNFRTQRKANHQKIQKCFSMFQKKLFNEQSNKYTSCTVNIDFNYKIFMMHDSFYPLSIKKRK